MDAPSPIPVSVAARPWRHRISPEARLHATAARFLPAVEALHRLEPFTEVRAGDLRRFAQLGTERGVDKDTALRVAPDGDAASLAVILEGEAMLYLPLGGTRVPRGLDVLAPGDLLGAAELFGATERSAAVRALTPLRLLEWDRDAVVEALHRWPDVARALLGALARRQDALERRVACTGDGRAVRRVARLLVELVVERGVRRRDARGRWGVVIPSPPTRTRLAGMAGTTRETVSRAFAAWRRRGWLSDGDGILRVLDEDALAREAGLGVESP